MNCFDAFAAQLQSAGLFPVDAELDDLVHDCFDEQAINNNPHCPDSESTAYQTFYDRASQQASDLNNLGTDAQLRYLHAAGLAQKTMSFLQEVRRDA